MAGDATTLLTSQIAAAAACTYALNLLQQWSKAPWITKHTASINVLVRAGLALGATLGINAVWTASTGTLVISGLSLASVAHGIWHWFSQYALTHLAGSALEKGNGGDKTPVAAA